VGDVIDELRDAVAAARASQAGHDQDHERVKELLVRARQERPDLGPGDLEEITAKYFDRATISRITVPKLGGKPARKPTRRRPGS
jgi:hypothetical protein